MSNKKLTLARWKSACGLTRKDMRYWSYTDIVESTRTNANLAFEQGLITASVRDKAIEYGQIFANSKSY